VNETIDYEIKKNKDGNFHLTRYADVDWERCENNNTSTSRYMFSLRLGVISWTSKKQQAIALSTTKAKYMASTNVACETIYIALTST
jgi:hypothetical protein